LAGGGDHPPPPWRFVKDKAYLGSQVAPSRWLRPTCYLDGYPGLLWADLEGGQGPRAASSLLLPGPRGPWGLHSVESGSGRLTCLAETKRGSHPSSVHSGHIVDRVLAADEVKGSVLPSVSSGCTWSRPLEACVVVWPVLKLEEVASGQPPRTVPFTGLTPHLSY
jgi:hypothetical protein